MPTAIVHGLGLLVIGRSPRAFDHGRIDVVLDSCLYQRRRARSVGAGAIGRVGPVRSRAWNRLDQAASMLMVARLRPSRLD